MSQPLVTLTIDGRTVQVPKGTLLIQAIMGSGIDIPYFCYHPKLDPAGVCRMCMVQIEKIPKPQTACTTYVSEGMVVATQSEAVAELRRSVLEFTLVNHPLDCPVCDKGGECDLQDLTFRYGAASSRLAEAKEDKDKAVDLGQFIVLDNERCILCRRCTRFDDEIATEGNLIVTDRGHLNEVTTLAGDRYNSYFSGNTIELCPVGALTSDLYRFKARPWDLAKVDGVCAGCSVGCNVRLDYRHGKLLRLVSRDNPATDNGWLCDRGRFHYHYVASGERLSRPLIRQDGELVPASWSEALAYVAERLGRIKAEHGPAAIGLVGGGKLTNEEAYLFQKLARVGLGTNNVDHRVGGQSVASVGGYPGRMLDLNDANVVLVVDALPAETAPVLDLRIRRLTDRRKAKVAVIGAALPKYRGRHLRLQVRPGGTAALLMQLAQAAESGAAAAAGTGAPGAVAAGPGAQAGGRSLPAEAARLLSDLNGAQKVAVVWDGRDAAVGRALLQLAGALKRPARGEEPGRSVHILIPGEQTNSRGAEAAGCRPDLLPNFGSVSDGRARQAAEAVWHLKGLPGAPGLSTDGMLRAAAAGRLKALYLAGAHLDGTFPDGNLAAEALANVEFLVVQDLFLNSTALQADVVLPAAAWTNKSGTYTALDGLVQAIRASAALLPGTQTDGEIFAAVAAALGVRLGDRADLELSRLGLKVEEGAVLGGAPAATLPAGDAGGTAAGSPAAVTAPPDGEGGLLLVPVDRLYAGSSTALFDRGFSRARPEPTAFFHPSDAARLGIAPGEEVRLSAGGQGVLLKAAVRKDVLPGTVQAIRHLVEAPVNRLPGTVSVSRLHAEVAD
jgi:NADH-quinone oxidoreductase subunit G